MPSLRSAASFAAKRRIMIMFAAETSRGLQLAQMDTGVPILFCVLTCDTLEQAIDRAGLKGGNKGFEAGLGAMEMAALSNKLRARIGETRRHEQKAAKINCHYDRNLANLRCKCCSSGI